MEVTIIKIKICKDGVVYYNTNPNTDVWYSDLGALLKEISGGGCDINIAMGFNLIDALGISITINGKYDKYISIPGNRYFRINSDLIKTKLKKSLFDKIKDFFTMLFTTKEVITYNFVKIHNLELINNDINSKDNDICDIHNYIGNVIAKITEQSMVYCMQLKNINSHEWLITMDFDGVCDEQ